MAQVTVRWLQDGVTAKGGLAQLEEALASGWAWVDVLEPDEATMRELAPVFGLHDLAIEDCLHQRQRPKIDVYPSGLFVIWLEPYQPDGEIVPTRELDVFLGKNHLITVHDGVITALDEVVARSDEYMAQGADFVLHAIIDRMVDPILDIVDELADHLDEIEDALLQAVDETVMQSIYVVRRRLVRLHRIIGPEREIIRALARERDIVDEEAYRYLLDVGDHLARVEDSIETAREVASAAMDIYLSAVSNRMNQIMKVLTAVATIFMPLTLISGIYGMNVTVGMWPPTDAAWSFPAITASLLVIALWMVWFFRRRKWW